ncbi:hypothetical protein, partial [Porcipelethomonas sp.]|uniref:hypothetical protein n=1 Tax=Porcipelethomonas sp. TaxID=2981675 RepID=UPI003EF0C6FE
MYKVIIETQTENDGIVTVNESFLFGTGENERPGFEILSPEVDYATNSAGTFSFTIYPNHPRYDDVDDTRAIIKVMCDGEDEPVFRGRFLSSELGFCNEKKVVCEGELAFLCDTIQRPYDYSIIDSRKTIQEMFELYLGNYNSNINDVRKKIYVGDIKHGDNEKHMFLSSEELNTLDSINNIIIRYYGGTIYINHKSGKAYLNYVDSESGSTSTTINLPEYPSDGKKDTTQIAYKVSVNLGTKDVNGRYNTVDIYGTGSYLITGYKLSSNKITLSQGKAGEYKFTIPSTHPYYSRMTSANKDNYIFTVKQSGIDEPVFKGRISTIVQGTNKKTVTCEGELAYLKDVNQGTYEYKEQDWRQKISWYFNKFIDNHNRKIDSIYYKDSRYRFEKGNITIADAETIVEVSESEYLNTFETIMTKLIDVYGGFLQVRHKNGKNYLDWLAEPDSANTQTIEFGENLLDISRTFDAESMGTVIIPLGKEVSDGSRITISGYDGSPQEEDSNIVHLKDTDFIYSIKVVEKYGWIEKTIVYDDVYSKAVLYTRAWDYLDNVSKSLSIDLTAADLSAVNTDFDRFKLNQYVEVTSKPHNLSGALYTVSRMSISLVNPTKNKLTLGFETATITSQIRSGISTSSALSGSTGSAGDGSEAILKTAKTYAEAQAAAALENAKKYADDVCDDKVDKANGKELSDNNFTDELKNKLDGIEDGANKTIVDDALSGTSTNPVQNKVVQTAVDNLISVIQDNYLNLNNSKVDKAVGMGLSANNFTDELKEKL